MKQRTAKQMMMESLDQLDDATEAMLIIAHKDGTISWHNTVDTLHTNLGLVNYVETLIRRAIVDVRDLQFEDMPETLH